MCYNIHSIKQKGKMSDKQLIIAQKRDLNKKIKIYQQEGKIVGNMYGQGESQPIILSSKDVVKLLSTISESTVFYLKIDDKKETPVILGEVQKHPVSGEVIHLSLRKINLKEKITAEIEIETIGQFTVPGAVFILAQSEVEAKALPNDLPESFTIDLSRFKAIGDQFTFADLEYDRSKITLKIENEHDPIAVVNAVEEEVEEVAAPVTEATETTVATDATNDKAPEKK